MFRGVGGAWGRSGACPWSRSCSARRSMPICRGPRVQAPPINWGDPSTPGGFWWVVSASIYRPLVFGIPLADLPHRLAAWGTEAGRQLGGGPWGMAIALVGLWRLEQTDRRWWWTTTLIALAYTAYSVGYNSIDSYVYLIPAWAMASLWAGHGMAWLADARRGGTGSALGRGGGDPSDRGLAGGGGRPRVARHGFEPRPGRADLPGRNRDGRTRCDHPGRRRRSHLCALVQPLWAGTAARPDAGQRPPVRLSLVPSRAAAPSPGPGDLRPRRRTAAGRRICATRRRGAGRSIGPMRWLGSRRGCARRRWAGWFSYSHRRTPHPSVEARFAKQPAKGYN